MNPLKKLVLAIRRHLGIDELLSISRDLQVQSQDLTSKLQNLQAWAKDLDARVQDIQALTQEQRTRLISLFTLSKNLRTRSEELRTRLIALFPISKDIRMRSEELRTRLIALFTISKDIRTRSDNLRTRLVALSSLPKDLRARTDQLNASCVGLRALLDSHHALSQDLHASQVFHDRIIGSSWFTRPCLSPGRWAVDYGFLKTLYNVLSAMQPKNILEFGLGQSSKLVHQYAAHFGANALTCENSDDWISFFFQSENPDAVPQPLPSLSDTPFVVDSSLGYPVKIRRLPLEQVKIRDALTTTYRDVETVFAGQRFDFILVDGPRGEPRFSRSQIISLAERNLADRFCILVDDSQRPGEQETIAEVLAVLRRNDIPFSTATNPSTKSHTLIFTPSLGFLGST